MCKDPIVVAALITVGGMVFTVLANLIFNYVRGKANSEEKFFYFVYHRRIALYERVIKILAAMGKTEAAIYKMSKQEFSDKVFADFHTLLVLFKRLLVYGNPETAEILKKAISKIEEIHGELSRDFSDGITVLSSARNMTPLEYVMNSFILIINDALFKFTDCISEEAVTNFINAKTKKLLKISKINRKKNNVGNNPDRPINERDKDHLARGPLKGDTDRENENPNTTGNH